MINSFNVPATDAGVVQLDWAIRLFIDHGAFIPTITLARSARSVFEVLLQRVQTDTAFNSVRTVLADRGYGNLDEIGKIINAPGNFLKHADESQFDNKSADLKATAIYEIALATTNLARLEIALTHECVRFVNWVDQNHPEMWVEPPRL